MARRRQRFGLVLAALAGLAVLASTGCFDESSERLAGGGGVETTEGNLASLTASPVGARVSLIPADFDPLRDTLPDSLTVLADARGVYRFRGLAPGRYNLEAYNPFDGTRRFRPGVRIAMGDRTIPGTDTLVAPGRLRLLWDGARQGVLTQTGRDFRLDLAGTAADSGGITLDSLPAGLLPSFTFTDGVDSATLFRTDSIRILPGLEDTIVVREEWVHSAVVTWDTTYRAPSSLIGYPLLVRLAAPDFPFHEAAPGGADLRFTTTSGEPLPHAVDRWDSATGRAEIWVRLEDTSKATFGTLRMDWGNPAAVYRGGPVFDHLSGYAGVWHLDGNSSAGQGRLKDSGPFALPTTAVDLVSESQGLIGGAQRFDGLGAYASAPDPDPVRRTAQLYVSAWISPDTAGMLGRTPPETLTIVSNWREEDSTGFHLAYVPDEQLALVTLGFGDTVTRLGPILLLDSAVAWHLVGVTYDGTKLAFFSHGSQVGDRPARHGDLPLPAGEYLIGARRTAGPGGAKGHFFRGAIDEVRVFRSFDHHPWPSMDYDAQQPGSSMVRFQKLR